MYTLAGSLSDVEVEPGSNLLLLGPAMSGKKRFAYEVLAEGVKNGEGAIVVSMSNSANRIFESFSELLGQDPRLVSMGVVDCVSKQQGVEGLDNTEYVKYASAPDDMTKIGISLSEFLEQFNGQQGLERNRACLDNISTMLMYADIQTIFRFLHVFTGRVQNVDGLGIYLMDPSAHDTQTVNTLKGLFDGIIEADEAAESGFTYAGVDM